jgi:CubicO group peptidase (beta-lactamase class C family)
VPADNLDRFATDYWADQPSGELRVFDPPEGGYWNQPPAFLSGGGGLVSTVEDYLAFAQMLLNRGKHGAGRVLSRPSVELMTTNHLTDGQLATAGLILGDGRGWGFGVAVELARADLGPNLGSYGWDGGIELTWFNDPKEELIGILMTQCTSFADLSASGPGIRRDFRAATLAALVD